MATIFDMRRGDCCLLPWKDVDLKQGFITVKMAKTGLAQKVTGHKTTETILKHYFQPGRVAFRQVQSAMPKLLTNWQKSPKEEMHEILTGMTAKTLKMDKARREKNNRCIVKILLNWDLKQKVANTAANFGTYN